MERKEILWDNGPIFHYDTALFPPGTDSFALGYFARPRRGEKVCDLGSGCGLLGTLLLAREPSLTLYNVEINPAAAAIAERNFTENGWAERVHHHIGDLRNPRTLPPAGSMDYCLSNPPYFKAGSGAACEREERQRERSEEQCTLNDVCAAAKYLLRWGGSFAMVHRPERLSDVLYAMREHGMEPKRLRFVLAGSEAAPSLFLVEGRRGGKSGLVVSPPLVIGSREWDKVYFR